MCEVDEDFTNARLWGIDCLDLGADLAGLIIDDSFVLGGDLDFGHDEKRYVSVRWCDEGDEATCTYEQAKICLSTLRDRAAAGAVIYFSTGKASASRTAHHH